MASASANRIVGMAMGLLLFGVAFGIAVYRDARMRPIPASAYYTTVVRYTHAEMHTTRTRGSHSTWLVLDTDRGRLWLPEAIWKRRYAYAELAAKIQDADSARVWLRERNARALRGLRTATVEVPPELGVAYDRTQSGAAGLMVWVFAGLGVLLLLQSLVRIKVNVRVDTGPGPGQPPQPPQPGYKPIE